MYDLVKLAFIAAGLPLKKVTHSFRGSGARLALEAGCTLPDVECLGHWNPDKMRQCYTQVTPINALLKVAGHTDDRHFLARADAQPYATPELVECARQGVFPWAETMHQRLKVEAPDDSSGLQFLRALIDHGRDIVMQDLAALFLEKPSHPYVRRSHLTKHKHFMQFATRIRKVQEDHMQRGTKRERVELFPPYTDRGFKAKNEPVEFALRGQIDGLAQEMRAGFAKINASMSSVGSKSTPVGDSTSGEGQSQARQQRANTQAAGSPVCEWNVSTISEACILICLVPEIDYLQHLSMHAGDVKGAKEGCHETTRTEVGSLCPCS